MKVVLDTNIIIDYLRNGQRGIEFFDNKDKQNLEFFIPTIVIYELYSGKSMSNNSVLEKLMKFIHYFKRIEMTEKIAIRAGELYRQTGKTIGTQDYIIAASAVEIGASVLTLNAKHFAQIPNISVYSF